MKYQAGYYWVCAKGQEVAHVAITDGAGRWFIPVRIESFTDDEVYVMGPQLWPPDARSGCVHPAIARCKGKCVVCGTVLR